METVQWDFFGGGNSPKVGVSVPFDEKMEFSQPERDKGVSLPGAFKLNHLQPFKPILFGKFSNFPTFILGSPFPDPPMESVLPLELVPNLNRLNIKLI